MVVSLGQGGTLAATSAESRDPAAEAYVACDVPARGKVTRFMWYTVKAKTEVPVLSQVNPTMPERIRTRGQQSRRIWKRGHLYATDLLLAVRSV